MADIRTTFSDYRPGHTRPVDLRIVVGYDDGSAFLAPSTLLRIHGTGCQTLAAIGVLARDGYRDLDLLLVETCSERFHCTHSYWRGPARLTAEAVLAALTTLAGIGGTTNVPYAEPLITGE